MALFENVLLIDDNEINNVMHERLIEIAGFGEKIVVMPSGVDALTYLKNEVVNDLSKVPDIIFLDIRMPIIDGFGFLAEYVQLPETITRKPKVVMLSSTLDEQDYDKAKGFPQVVSFLVKPLSVDKLSALEIPA
ncbi:MAG TPA: response regulator [Bacteroidetes bacterium]|nr:response regulator [Bacteroidota bacterium]